MKKYIYIFLLLEVFKLLLCENQWIMFIYVLLSIPGVRNDSILSPHQLQRIFVRFGAHFASGQFLSIDRGEAHQRILLHIGSCGHEALGLCEQGLSADQSQGKAQTEILVE